MADNHSADTILQEALEISDLAQREEYLAEVCGEDEGLREEIESLLAAHIAAESFMDTLADPVWTEVPGEKEGDRIGRYKLLQQIGEGGFGTVYMAEQTEPVVRRVALKVIKAGMDSKEVIARFEAERQALALMDHPNIAQVHDAGTTDGGRPYFVMELVKGIPLTTYCAEKDLDTEARLALFTDVCAAVQHAHQKGIIHRDLKPSNILVSPHDGKPVVKVIDFGIAKAISMELTEKTVFTAMGRMIGTPQYMSPEQAELNAFDVDTRSDIYSLGVVLYELLTGTTPLDGGQLRSAAYDEMQRMIREETPVKPSTRVSSSRTNQTGRPSPTPDSRTLRGDLDWIVMKALEKERARRYETANGLALDIRRHLRDEPVLAGPPSARYRLRKFVRRNRRGLLSGAAVAVALLAGLWVAGGFWLKERQRVAEVDQRAGELIADATDLMARNAAADYDDDSFFRQAQERVGRLESLVGVDQGNEGLDADQQELLDAVAVEERTRKLITDLEEALIGQMSGLSTERPDGSTKRETLAKAFAEFGMDPLELPVEESVERITGRREAVQDRILVGIVAWSDSLETSEPAQAARLDEIIERADSDPWRNSLREAVKAGDADALRALADSDGMAGQPTMTVVRLSDALGEKQLAGALEKLLRRAQREAPTSFWPNFMLGTILAGGIHREEGRDIRETTIETPEQNIGGDFSGGPKASTAKPEFEEAIGFLRAALAARPDADTVRMILGLSLSAGGHPEEAIATLQQAVHADPESSGLDGLLGTTLLGVNRAEEALPHLRREVEREPDSVLWNVKLAQALAVLGKYEEARAAFLKVGQLQPDEEKERSSLKDSLGREVVVDESMAHQFLASAQLARGDVDQALASIQAVLDLNPENVNGHVFLGLIRMRKREFDAAILSFEEAIKLAPDLSGAHEALGMVRAGQGDFEAALSSLREAVRLAPEDASAHCNLGATLAETGEYDEAVKELNIALELSPIYAMAVSNLGVTADRQGKSEEAIGYYREALKHDPGYGLALKNLAKSLWQTEEYDESIAIYRRWNDPTGYFTLGSALFGQGRNEDAIDAFERAIALKPDFALAHDTLGSLYGMTGRPEDALESYRTTVRLAPHASQGHGNLGFVLLLQGEYEEALDSLMQGMELDTSNKKAEGNLQGALLASGRLTGAHLLHGDCGSPDCGIDSVAALDRDLQDLLQKLGPDAPEVQAGVRALSRHIYQLALTTFTQATPTPKELRAFWEEHRKTVEVVNGNATVRTITIGKDTGEARSEVASLREQTLAGADFGELARKHSKDFYADKGGLRPDQKFGDMNGVLTEAAFFLPVGEMSEVLEDEKACYLLKVEARKPKTTIFFMGDEVKGATMVVMMLERRKAWEKRYLARIQDPAGDLLTARVKNLVGMMALAAGDTERAMAPFQEALATRLKELRADDLKTLESKNNLAMCYRASGDHKKALPLAQEAFAGREAQLDPGDPAVLISMGNLAIVHLEMGNPELGRSLAERALDGWKNSGSEHPGRIKALNNLAAIYLAEGEVDRALPMLEEVVGVLKEKAGLENPETLVSMTSLAAAYAMAKDVKKEIGILEEIVAWRRVKKGLDDPETLQAMVTLAVTYTQGEDFAGAARLTEDIVAWQKENLGLGDARTLQSMNHLLGIYAKNKDFVRAIALMEEILAWQKEILGDDDPRTLQTMKNLAAACANAKDFAKAIPLSEELRKILEEKLGRDNDATLQATIDLAVVYREAGRPEEAMPPLEEVRGIAKNQGTAFRAGIELLPTYDLAGEPEKLEPLAGELIAEAQEGVGNVEENHAGLLAQLGVHYLELGAFQAAELFLRECADIRERVLPPDSWYHFTIKSLLGEALLGQKNYDAAEPLLRDGYEGIRERFETIPPQGKHSLSRARESLIRFHETRGAQGDAEQAAAYRADLEQEQKDDTPAPRDGAEPEAPGAKGE